MIRITTRLHRVYPWPDGMDMDMTLHVYYSIVKEFLFNAKVVESTDSSVFICSKAFVPISDDFHIPVFIMDISTFDSTRAAIAQRCVKIKKQHITSFFFNMHIRITSIDVSLNTEVIL